MTYILKHLCTRQEFYLVYLWIVENQLIYKYLNPLRKSDVNCVDRIDSVIFF